MKYEIQVYNGARWVMTGSYCGGLSRYQLIHALLATFARYEAEQYHFYIKAYDKKRVSRQIENKEAKAMLLRFSERFGFDLTLYGSQFLPSYKEINEAFKTFRLSPDAQEWHKVEK